MAMSRFLPVNDTAHTGVDFVRSVFVGPRAFGATGAIPPLAPFLAFCPFFAASARSTPTAVSQSLTVSSAPPLASRFPRPPPA